MELDRVSVWCQWFALILIPIHEGDIPAMKLYLNKHYGSRNRTVCAEKIWEKEKKRKHSQEHWDQVPNLTALSDETKLII